MRFLSRYGEFGVQLRPQVQEAYATGMARVVQEGVYAMFHVQGLTVEEQELANAHWRGSWNGFYQAEDEVTVIPPDYRIGVFDSEQAQLDSGWSDELRLQVEQDLIVLADRFNDMIPVPVLALAPPWPRYDEYTGTPAALVRKLVDEGHSLEAVLAYERENQGRVAVIAELEGLLGSPGELATLHEEVVG